jgi:hypothetical protein
MSRPSVILVVSMGLLTACARQHVLEAPIRSAAAPVVMACPLGVPHTKVELVETAKGADLVFTTNEQRAPELRARVHEQALRGPGRREGHGHLGEHGLAHDHGLKRWALPPHEAHTVDTPQGGIIQLTSVDPARREELVAEVKTRLGLLDARDCW